MPITQTSSMTSYRTETANPPQKDWAFGGSIKCPYCLNRVKPQSRFNWGIFLLLFISTWVLLEVPAIAYWGLRHGRYKCPNCNLSPLFDKQRHIVSMPEN